MEASSKTSFPASSEVNRHPEFNVTASGRLLDENGDFLTDEGGNRLAG